MKQFKLDYGLLLIINAIALIGVAGVVMGSRVHTASTQTATESKSTLKVEPYNPNAAPMNSTTYLQPAMTARDLQPTVQANQLQ